MALPTTTASSISLSQIQTEFGGSNPIALSEYKRGGTYVPSGTATGTYGTAIPTTNSNLSMKNYYGTQSVFTSTMTVGFLSFLVGNYGYFQQYYFTNGNSTVSQGSMTDYTIDTMTGTPTIRKLMYTTSGAGQLYVSGDQRTASPNITSLDWENTTQSTSGTWTTGTKTLITSWPNTTAFTQYAISGDLAFSTNTSDNVIWTFNVS